MVHVKASQSRKRLFISWATVLSYLILIFYLSSLSDPVPFEPPVFLHIDKIYHFIEYLILGFLLLNAFYCNTRLNKAVLSSAIFALSYAVSDEVHQYFVPLRDASFLDLLADSFGAWTGILFGRVWFKRRNFNNYKTGKEFI